ncbi:GH25 family lysozyme [Periweissella fabalis]|uniref:Lysozyme n=1 Tax=Periweissella fabalis TaxID=1070421 RepID=A0A7X6N3C4_9LACO|nr:GH25 family lysozyme [Periweissella fabalis]MCM0598397.1 hypothetical protein [Periweissella fabalis]NKZ25021.1 hypothetical protein [Periweissella fabalis]
MVQIKAHGTDQARWQGPNGKRGYGRDSFAILQIGGYSPSTGIYNQATYPTQLTAMADLRLHTYIWFEVGGDANKAKLVLDYFLPRIKTPKGSIVAIDYEQGASSNVDNNTNAILYAMDRIAQAGYTPMLYTGKPYIYAHVDVARFLSKYPSHLWLAAYPDYQVRSEPLFDYFPSMAGIGMWQFTSTYVLGGLDGNVDLTGITFNGYSQQPKPTPQPAPQSNGIAVDGIAGVATVKAMQHILGSPEDGYISGQTNYSKKFAPVFSTVQLGAGGSSMIKKLQYVLGVAQDGYFGPSTIAALQARLHVYPDGYAGASTVKQIQANLNRGHIIIE